MIAEAGEPRVGTLPLISAVWTRRKAFECILKEAKCLVLVTRSENSEHADTFNSFTLRCKSVHPRPSLARGGCCLPEETTPCPPFQNCILQTTCKATTLSGQRSGNPEDSLGSRSACATRNGHRDRQISRASVRNVSPTLPFGQQVRPAPGLSEPS